MFPIVVLNQGAQAATNTIVRRGLAAPSTSVPGAAQKAGVQRLRLGLDQVNKTLLDTDVATGDAQRLSGTTGCSTASRSDPRRTPASRRALGGGGWGGVARVARATGALPAVTEPLASTTPRPSPWAPRPVRSTASSAGIEPGRRSAPRRALNAR